MPGAIVGANVADSSGWNAAGETWTYVSADAPTFVFSGPGDLTTIYSPGMRVRYVQSATTKYGIITKVAVNGGVTEITIYGGTDYTLANAAITDPYFSLVKAPFGFPLDPNKWTVTATDSSNRSQGTPAQNTWYNLGPLSLAVPIGVWRLGYIVAAAISDASSSAWSALTTLSTANNSESDTGFTTGGWSTSTARGQSHIREKVVTLAVKTTYYLNTRTADANLDSILNRNDVHPAVITAVCAYL